MIVVTVRLDSANGPQYDAELFTMVIGNDGTGGLGNHTSRIGNYNVWLGRKGQTDPYRIIRKPLRHGRVEGHPRLSAHPGVLVRKALQAVKL